MADTRKRRPRRRFDDHFKAVRLVLDQGKSDGDACAVNLRLQLRRAAALRARRRLKQAFLAIDAAA